MEDIRFVEEFYGSYNQLNDFVNRYGSHDLFIYEVVQLLNDNRIYKHPECLSCVEELLNLTIVNSGASESLNKLLDLIHRASVEKFSTLLKTIKFALTRVTSKETRLKNAFDEIESYLQNLSPPADHETKSDQKIMLGEDSSINTVFVLLNNLICFLDSFLEEADLSKNTLSSFGFHLLAQPAMYVYLEKHEELNHMYRAVVENIERCTPNTHYLLDCLNERNFSHCMYGERNSDVEEAGEDPSLEDRILDLHLALYYFVKTEDQVMNAFPYVYNKLYIFHKLLYLSIVLSQQEHNAAARKGLLLGERLLNWIDDNSIQRQFLELRVHEEFVKIVSKISVDSYIVENRKTAIELLLKYIRKFDAEGTYALYSNIFTATRKHDVDSEIITSFRRMMYASFKTNKYEYFQRGKLVVDLLKAFSRYDEKISHNFLDSSNKTISLLHLFALMIRNGCVKHEDLLYFDRTYFNSVQNLMKDCRNKNQLLAEELMKNENQARNMMNVVVDGGRLPELEEEDINWTKQNVNSTLGLIEEAFRLVYEYWKDLVHEDEMLRKQVEASYRRYTTRRIIPVCSIYVCHRGFCDNRIKNEVIEDAKSSSLQQNAPSSSDNDSEKQTQDNEYENNVRNKILEASLNFVAEHGWTRAAIVAGAQSIGYPGVISEMFPLGGSDLVLYYYSVCNERLREYLKERAEKEPPDDKLNPTKVKLFIYDAVEKRLRMITPYVDKWPQALATLTLSKAVPTALSNLLTLVDDICYYAGDRSVDFNWYVRRIALAGIYKVTELYMLQDKSPDYEETWKFLKKQLDDAVNVYSCIQQSEQAGQLTKEISLATFTTARNILGLNNWKR